jgi:hypothetical protein
VMTLKRWQSIPMALHVPSFDGSLSHRL